MVSQLLLCKRLYVEGCAYVDRDDAFSSGMATSLFQDACELAVWALIKQNNIKVDDMSSITANIKALKSNALDVPAIPLIQELNKARVGFKHYGILPAREEAIKFQGYALSFLEQLLSQHFQIDFGGLSLSDLVPQVEVRERLKAVEAALATGDREKATTEIAIAKTMLLKALPQLIPMPPVVLNNVERELKRIPGFSNLRVFSGIHTYLCTLRDAALAALTRVPVDEFDFIQNVIPRAESRWDRRDEWQIYHPTKGLFLRPGEQLDEQSCRTGVGYLVNFSLRLNDIDVAQMRARRASRRNLMGFVVRTRTEPKTRG